MIGRVSDFTDLPNSGLSMRLSLIPGGRPPSKTTVALVQELETAGVHIPGISAPPIREHRLRLVGQQRPGDGR
jgi:hypothetical protein